jgi:hypothetical protein
VLVKWIDSAAPDEGIECEFKELVMGMNAKQRRVQMKHRRKRAKFRAQRREQAQAGGVVPRPVTARR